MPDNSNGAPKIGVYVCYCGGNISDVVQCEKVAKSLQKVPGVVVAKTNMSLCSDAGQSMIEEDIREFGLDRVVIGACAPSLHEQTFRGTVTRAGMNPYLYYHVGLREQDSWVSKSDKNGATSKATQLMMAGVAKAKYLEPLEPILLEAEKHALVIGGGVSGMRAAYDLARSGLRVTLIEKSPFLGGRTAQLEKLFPTEENAKELVNQLIEKIVNHPNITVFTCSQMIDSAGYVGDYHITIEQQSRGVSDDNAEELLTACTQEVPDEFNYGLSSRKVIYRAYPGCYPSTTAVDWDNYDGRPIQVNGQKVHLENHPNQFELNVGAILVATGFNPYEPRTGEYGYKQQPNVITLPQMIRYLAMQEDSDTLLWQGNPVRDIAFIHCVGSREIDGIHEPQEDGSVNNYCSRVCCTATLHMINDLHERYPSMNIYDVYEDIRTYGRGHEKYYQDALSGMTRFLRFHGDENPEVVATEEGDTHPTIVKLNDYLTWGEEIEAPADLIVLATGIMPRNVDDLVSMLKISRGTDRFLLEVHPKLRPVETAVPGIVLAGTAQGPMNVQESIAASSAAAAKVAALLGQGKVDLEPFVAKIDLDKCDGTGSCIEVCQYEDAISLQTLTIDGQEVRKAVISPANCAGCGSCVSACPNLAIDVQGWTLKQYEAMVDSIALDLTEFAEVMA